MQNQQITFPIGVGSISLPADLVIQNVLQQAFSAAKAPGAIPALGEYWPGEGGHNAGLVRGEDGKPDYYLIVPAGADAETKAAYGGYEHETEGANSASDGLANTKALLADSEDHPAALWASKFTRDGHSDFYLPSRRELQVAEANVPELFNKGWHWSSTQYSANFAYITAFGDGGQLNCVKKPYERLVRPVRRRFI